MDAIYVKTLGELSLRCGDNRISDSDNRTRKIWLLLAYLLCRRGQVSSQRKLIELLWGDDPTSTNPENALRITFHRVRTLLNGLWPTAGRELILFRDNGYAWNEEIPVLVDAEEFETLCAATSEDEDARLEICRKALALYDGEFLEKQSGETWVIPIATHYHNLFLNTTLEAAELLLKKGDSAGAAALCRRAAATEPYHEVLHQTLIRALAAGGNVQAAEGVYEGLRKRLFEDFGIRPSEQTLAVYRKAVHSPDRQSLPAEELLDQLKESEPKNGALQCDYDYFKVLCHSEARNLERSGSATHVVLLSVTSAVDRPLTKRSMNRIVEQLGEQIRTNLRRGDTFSRCSATQYIILLPKANYENSCMVSRRLIGAFQRAHPHVAAKINYLVQPLTPTVCIP